jgi:hypothetical protein
MIKNELFFLQIKENVLKNLKEINLAKKNKDLLLDLIKLYDILAKDSKEEFINSLISLINDAETENDVELREELQVRLASLNTQLERDKFTEIRHFPCFSLYIKKEKVDIYIKKIASSWDSLITEIKKIKFEKIRVVIYKSATKKEKILNKSLKNVTLNNKAVWEKELIDIVENNICVNIHIILDLEKENLN